MARRYEMHLTYKELAFLEIMVKEWKGRHPMLWSTAKMDDLGNRVSSMRDIAHHLEPVEPTDG